MIVVSRNLHVTSFRSISNAMYMLSLDKCK